MKLATSSRSRVKAKPPWHRFRVGTPSDNPRWTETDCWPFDEVWHVTHTPNAITILENGTIRPQLVYDESILNTRRTLVNWVSPNHWSPGYRYGNIAFNFDWYELIKGKQYYWVEWIDYSPNACRILITENDYDDDPQLRRYDPSQGDGPWWWDRSAGTHYRNGKFCLEFMLEFELQVSDSNSIGLVKHHDTLCCIDSSRCPDLGRDDDDAAACLLAGIIAEISTSLASASTSVSLGQDGPACAMPAQRSAIKAMWVVPTPPPLLWHAPPHTPTSETVKGIFATWPTSFTAGLLFRHHCWLWPKRSFHT